MTALGALLALAAGAAPTTLAVPGFGDVAIHEPATRPARVVLLLSGAAGVDRATSDLAAGLAARGALVAAVDTRGYLASRGRLRCAYPAGDLEELALSVQKARQLDAYERPLLVGEGPGAAVAWAAVAQAPSGTFAGAVAVGPCPERPLPFRLCAGSGPPPRALAGGELPALVPVPAPLELISGADDSTCPAPRAAAFANAIGARFTHVPGAGHGLPPPVAAAVDAALARLGPAPQPAAPSAGSVADLPVVEVAAKTAGTRLAILLTGDGGWVGIDKALAAAFAGAGVAVVGLDSLRYLWKRRTPEETARDVGRIAAHYREAWHRDELLLVGYSRGADLAPFIAARLPPGERARVRLVAMLGPGTFAEFEVHAIDLFSSRRRAAALPTEPAVRSTGGAFRVLCVHGSEERDSLCPRIAELPFVKDVLVPGGHHFDGGYRELARIVLDAADGR